MNKKFLLDTNVCIFFMRGKYGIAQQISKIGRKNCCISEITVAELLFGAANCSKPEDRERHKQQTMEFVRLLDVIPISECLSVFAEEKSRLRKQGTTIDDFDLLIAATAKKYNCILVTDNIKHMERVKDVQLENWIER